MGSLTTCDPGDITVTLASCKALNVRCSVISLAAEVRLGFKYIFGVPYLACIFFLFHFDDLNRVQESILAWL
jgi:hypothetical protein